jgi:hypothetical protein
MGRILKKTVRKLVTLPLELAERVDEFRQRTEASSESDALKALIEDGLKRYDSPKDLYDRCEATTAAGKPIGDLITLVTADHPLVESTRLDGQTLVVYLARKEATHRARFVFTRASRDWSVELYADGQREWVPASFSDEGQVTNDDIPF